MSAHDFHNLPNEDGSPVAITQVCCICETTRTIDYASVVDPSHGPYVPEVHRTLEVLGPLIYPAGGVAEADARHAAWDAAHP